MNETSNAEALFDLFMVKGFLEPEICRQLIDELRHCQSAPATVYGMGKASAVDERVRKVNRLIPSQATVDYVREQLLNCRSEIEDHFGVNLNNCEEPQFLRYCVGDFFVAHQDGNTGLLFDEREQRRKISIVIILNRQSEAGESDTFCGGSLVFSEWRPGYKSGRLELTGEAGRLVTFRAEITHEVIPVTQGERYSIVSWYI
jgi:SM-20-related protein